MNTYYFEHWVQGRVAAIVKREADSMTDGVARLSESFPKGVFKFIKETRLVWNGKESVEHPYKVKRNANRPV